jgi:hypothetical protein
MNRLTQFLRQNVVSVSDFIYSCFRTNLVYCTTSIDFVKSVINYFLSVTDKLLNYIAYKTAKQSHNTYGGAGGSGGMDPTHSRSQYYMGVSGQRHAPAALYPGKGPPVPVERSLGGPQSRSGHA